MTLIDRVREILPPKHRELAKFIVVGGSSWIVDTGLFTVLSHTVLNEKVITSKIISVLVSTIFSYILNREWSFNGRGGRERHHEAMLFFLFNAIALGVNLIPLWLSHYVFDINPAHYSRLTVTIVDFITANVVGTLVAMAFRYWAYRRWVFPDELALPDEASSEALVASGPVNGGVVKAGSVNGGSVNGGSVNGGSVNGGSVNGGPVPVLRDPDTGDLVLESLVLDGEAVGDIDLDLPRPR